MEPQRCFTKPVLWGKPHLWLPNIWGGTCRTLNQRTVGGSLFDHEGPSMSVT